MTLKKIPFINPGENYKSFSFRIAILMEMEGKYLMVVNENDIKFKHPGGHVHMGESLTDAIIREVREETGYELQDVSEYQIVFDHIDSDGNIMINGYMKMSIDNETANKILLTSPLESKLFTWEELNEQNSWKSEVRIIEYFLQNP